MAYLRYKTLKEKQNSKCATMDSNQLFMMVQAVQINTRTV